MSKVLIVDDQPAVRTALETLFEVHDLPAVSVAPWPRPWISSPARTSARWCRT
jgi:CheY-like chemotaxis protein